MADARRSRGGWGHPCCPAAKIEQPVTMSSRQILKTSNQKSLSAPATRAGYHSRERASGPSIKSSEHLIDCPLVTCTWDPLYALITFAAHNSQQVGSTICCGCIFSFTPTRAGAFGQPAPSRHNTCQRDLPCGHALTNRLVSGQVMKTGSGACGEERVRQRSDLEGDVLHTHRSGQVSSCRLT